MVSPSFRWPPALLIEELATGRKTIFVAVTIGQIG